MDNDKSVTQKQHVVVRLKHTVPYIYHHRHSSTDIRWAIIFGPWSLLVFTIHTSFKNMEKIMTLIKQSSIPKYQAYI